MRGCPDHEQEGGLARWSRPEISHPTLPVIHRLVFLSHVRKSPRRLPIHACLSLNTDCDSEVISQIQSPNTRMYLARFCRGTSPRMTHTPFEGVDYEVLISNPMDQRPKHHVLKKEGQAGSVRSARHLKCFPNRPLTAEQQVPQPTFKKLLISLMSRE